MKKTFFYALLFPLALTACSKSAEAPVAHEQTSSSSSSVAPVAAVVPVELKHEDNRYQIYREGKPYFIRGAGGTKNLELLAASGANSVRTWDTDNAERILDEAQSLGLTVMLGLRLGHERHGFDYNDEAAVRAQKDAVREQVLKFKDHPALLVWGLGNEVDLHYTNTNVWFAIQDIAEMVRELDPNHLITTVTAGIDPEKAGLILERVPGIDYLSVNIYGGLETLPQTLLDSGWTGAYAVTEWGPTGHWQITNTAWDVPIEQTSTEKAASYRERYEAGINGAPDRSLGSYAFLWGQKQETTPTWYGVFLETGEPNEIVDSLQYLWTGAWPAERAPSITSFKIDDKVATDSIYLEAGTSYTVTLETVNRGIDPLSKRWEVLPESTDIRAGGDAEQRPQSVDGLITADNGEGVMQFNAPKAPGAYRLFTYVIDINHKAATANIPFYVR